MPVSITGMTTTAPDSRITEYNPVVSTTDFPAVFPVFDNDDIKVFVDGEERDDFVFSGTYVDGISNNAKAVFSVGVTGNVLVVGARDPHRTNRFHDGGPLPTRDQNLALDTIESEVQEISRDVGRALKVAYGETPPEISDLIDSIDEAIAAAAAAIGAVNLGFVFDTMAGFLAANIPSVIKTVDIRGYYLADDCPSWKMYRLAEAPAPVMPWHKQTADGGWWSYCNAFNLNIRMFGAKGLVLPSDAAVNRAAIQAAIDFKYAKGGGVVYASGFFYVGDTIYRPASIVIDGSLRHNVLREFGDTTSGVAHPLTGTVFHTSGAGTARLWTDESGNGSDALLRPLIAELGENGGVRGITLQTTTDANAWDIGLHICGVSRGYYHGLDVRGAWKKSAGRMDATWGRTNPRMMALAHLPAWFTADYATIYDYGLTNNVFDFCRFEGGKAFAVESGPNEAYATNGISDTKFRACEFYNDQSAVTLADRTGINGALIRLNFTLAALGGAQGLSFESCRFDTASRWTFDIDHWSNLDIKDGREFSETSGVYQTYQTGQGVPTEQARGRLRTTVNTTVNQNDCLRFDGEWFMNISSANAVGGDNAANVTPAAWVMRAEAGKRIIIKHGQTVSDANMTADGEIGTLGHIIRSWTSNGKISFQNMEGNVVNTWAFFQKDQTSWGTAYDQKWGAGTITFQRNGVTFLSYNGTNIISLPIYSDTTANAANVNIESDGRARRSTSAAKYKTNVLPIPDEMLDAMLQLRGVLYTSLCPGDDADELHMGSIADEAAELGLEPLVARGEDGEVEDFKYGRAFSALLEIVKRINARMTAIENSKE
ncbi:tail fiber domain-containing protein [Rhizobium mongolense]